jgi:hypothetical protein
MTSHARGVGMGSVGRVRPDPRVRVRDRRPICAWSPSVVPSVRSRSVLGLRDESRVRGPRRSDPPDLATRIVVRV